VQTILLSVVNVIHTLHELPLVHFFLGYCLCMFLRSQL